VRDQALSSGHPLLLRLYGQPDLREERRSVSRMRASVSVATLEPRRSMMRKRMNWVAVVLFAAVFCTGVAALLAAPPASAAGSTCWQVDCNTCCRVGNKVICTQRLCA